MLLERILLLSLAGTRRSTLRAWGTGKELGWIEEKHVDGGRLQVSVGWGSGEKDVTEVTLPDIAQEGIASSQWPAGLAGSILLKSPALQSALLQKSVLELGSGLGLAGLVAADAPASKCVLTDKDDDTVAILKGTVQLNQEKLKNIVAQRLEWRDEFIDAEEADVILGTDVAYYHYLLGPLMDAARSHMVRGDSLLYIVGLSNRESQWVLYHNIKEGYYNQRKDEREPPWKGQTVMLLYNLQVGQWTAESDTTGINEMEQEVPIAALVYARQRDKIESLMCEHDHVATREDEESQMMTF